MGPGFLIACIVAGLLLLLFFPFSAANRFTYRPPAGRVHEADSVLSRRVLEPGTRAYMDYYTTHPGFKDPDDRSRSAPGLLSTLSRYYHPGTFAAARANFRIIESLGLIRSQPSIYKDPMLPDPDTGGAGPRGNPDPAKTTTFIIEWLKRSGAHSVGITQLQPYHLYSHKGRGPLSGQPVVNNHSTAIAITVEMDHRMMRSAPAGTSVMESSEQYLRAGTLALKLAAFIRELGFDSTAHIDGNYEVICPLVAVDAGLGTIGRMGLLMTPGLGPRVRISVVTTDLVLTYSSAATDRTALHFCHLCRKCADNCPAAAIPDGPRSRQEGSLRWKIDSEKCYHFWTLSGTDCGRCITVCPYSHRDNWFHRFVRWGIKNNLFFRHLAIKLDDIFYGHRPSISPLPGWADIMHKP